MRFVSIFLLLISFSVKAQEENSLLWEISGNGLEKTSYLYGTMHVSKKIAFRLDDVFFDALDKSDMVALESDPGLWLEKENLVGGSPYGAEAGFVTKGFYARSFKVDNPRKEVLGAYLAYEDRIVNNILYRTNELSQNFEEETYLDMFIYQAGRKFNKPIIALEDMEESAALVGRASLNAIKQKPDEWLQKKMQQSDPMFLLQDAYRTRNIALLDSIDHAMYTSHYMKNMLYIRNANMAERMDSIMQKGKVFAGIGAAHLPGEEGVISLLKKKGYTVKPLVSKATSKGKRLKLKFEQKKRENQYSTYGPEDDFFSVDLPNKLYPVSDIGKTTYVSPDLANGSFVVINRIPTYSFLKKDALFSLEEIDKLLFENIPGKILEKKSIKKGPFAGLDIKNLLKNGDHQRYQIFETPLELVIIKMGGEGDYVTQFSDRIFNSLEFRADSIPVPKTVSSVYDDFEVRMPSLYSFTNRSRNGDRWIEGYDSIADNYYFLHKSVLNDFNFIEVDTFELKQIQKRFYQDLELKPDYGSFEGRQLTSSAEIDIISKKRLYLMTTLRQGEYYLLGMVGRHQKEADTFFESFKLKEGKNTKPFETVVDTALYFSTKSTVKPPKFVESSTKYYSGAPQVKPYDPFYKKTVYQNENGEAVSVELNKSHDFLMFKNIDSVWTLRKKLYAHKKYNIIEEKTKTSPKGYHELQMILTDTASTRGILVKNIINKGLLYELKAVVDTMGQPSAFVNEFFNNFVPKDTLVGRELLEDKVPEFFKALSENDSIALDGYRFIKFEPKHADLLKKHISEYDLNREDRHIQLYLIRKLAQLKGLDLTDFYRSFYAKSYNNSTAQAVLLQEIAKKTDEASTKLLLELMETDLPLLSNTFNISLIFKPYRENLELAKKLYPKLLDYSSIPEYKGPIFSLLAELLTQNTIKPKLYKKYKTQILNDAKTLIKRQLGSDLAHINNDFYKLGASKTNTILLENYTTLLYPFHTDKSVAHFFDQLELVEEPSVQATYLALLLKNGQQVSPERLTDLASDINGRLPLFKKLKQSRMLRYFPADYNSQQHLAEALLFEGTKYNKTKDSVVFITRKTLQFQGKTYVGYYFKKRTNEDYDKNFSMHLLVFEDEKELQTQPFYESEAMRIEDTDTEEEVIGYVTEAFELKDRRRADIYRPNGYGLFGHHGF
ncbi:TraB/GumN family protein [Zobellia uliginosa]|uniref:TraB/GumN family protein n=1 Tax=Zobellia uliginosa TaxID=143224 RepID=UPI0026E1E530|nr:TraB/GumN family protein [Zobellia uliginosa]MDO6516281.1 TraB/GumN family protein [Zobellia uliginosa]